MDIQTIDSQYSQLQGQADQTVQSLKALAGKLQAASQAGNPDAREWMLDLKEIALAIQAEQNQVANLLQALHGFVANQPQQMGSVPQTQQPWGAPQPQNYPPQGYPPQNYPPQNYPPQGYPPQQQGGILGGFLNSGFGRAITMGAGFGIGDSIINDIF
jgi:hypothetical protein